MAWACSPTTPGNVTGTRTLTGNFLLAFAIRFVHYTAQPGDGNEALSFLHKLQYRQGAVEALIPIGGVDRDTTRS